MASLLDALGLLETLGFYTVIFPFLLVLGIVYGILMQTKIFGESKSVNGLIATIIALIAVSILKVTIFITVFLQIVIAFLVVVFLIVLVFLFMGIKAETIGKALLHPAGYSTMIILFLIFAFIALSVTFPEISEVAETGQAETTGIAAASKILGNPTMLGLIVMFAIFVAAAAFITYTKD
jgi:hypothetical protein